MTPYDAERARLFLVAAVADLRAHEARAEMALHSLEHGRCTPIDPRDRADVVAWHAMLVITAFLRWTR